MLFPHEANTFLAPTAKGRAEHVRFSNRPVGVKRFQTIHRHGVDVARGLVLLFGIGTRALPIWDSRTRRNNLCSGLAVLQTTESKRTFRTHLIHRPAGTSFHHAVELGISLLSDLMLSRLSCRYRGLFPGVHRNSAAVSPDAVQDARPADAPARRSLSSSRSAWRSSCCPRLEPRPLRHPHQHGVEPLRRASPASSRRRILISHRFGRSRRIGTWQVSSRPNTAHDRLGVHGKRAGTSTVAR